MRKLLITPFLALLLIFFTTQQATADPYIGVSYGYNTADSSSDQDWGAQLGLRIIGILGLELGYIDLGTIGATDSTYIESDGWTYSAAVYMPIPVIDLYARGGGIQADVTSNIGGSSITSSSESKSFYGVGAGLKIGPINAFIEWDRYNLNPVEVDSTKVGVNLIF